MSAPPNTSFKDLPAPWLTRGPRAWWIITSLGLPTWGTSGKLPDSYFYDPEGSNKADFQGGTGMIQILRYNDTPAGPYDELLVIPGRFKTPSNVGQAAQESASLRISRIYVSNLETTYAGRRNWNIPKVLARFEFNEVSPTQTEVKVYPRDETDRTDSFSVQPFFAATLSSCTWSPAFPFNAGALPMSIQLAQPPLPSSQHPEVDAEVQTNSWALLEPKFKGTVKFNRVAGTLGEPGKMGDGLHFPDIRPYSWGIEFLGFEGYFTTETRVPDQAVQGDAGPNGRF